MNAGAWRAAALSAIVVAAAFVCYQATIPGPDDFGISFIVPRNAPGSIVITSVAPGSPAMHAGLRKGDAITYGSTALQRAAVQFAPPGSHVTVTANGTRSVTLTARRIAQPPIAIVPLIIRLAFLGVAALLAWRRPQDPATRALVTFLACYGLSIALDNGVLATPLLSLIVLQLLNIVLLLVGTAAAAKFAATFPSGAAKPLPRRLAALAQIIAAVAACIAIFGEFLTRTANAVSILTAIVLLAFVAIAVLVVVTLVVAYVQGEAGERQRRRWVFLLLGLALAAALVDAVAHNVSRNSLVDNLALIWIGLLPFGLAYVILRHRVIDVGFVVNRAVVYTIVSAIIVAIFMIVETLLSKYVEQTSRAGSMAAQVFVALVLGFSVRAIHARVDKFVDAVLFRDRHLADAALRFFAHDAPYITDADVVLSRCAKTVERYARARGVGIWTAQSPLYRAAVCHFDTAPEVDENDEAVVAMRARRAIVDLRETDSVLPGALAFPMIVRGELTGMLVCGPKIDDETYDPDERETLAYLAASVGHALDAIAVRDLRRRLEELTATHGGQPAF